MHHAKPTRSLVTSALCAATLLFGANLSAAESGQTTHRAPAPSTSDRLLESGRQVSAAATKKLNGVLGRASELHAATQGLFLLNTSVAREVWQPLSDEAALPERIVLLIHGLDDPGTLWDDAAPAIARGYDPLQEPPAPIDQRRAPLTVVRFEYPNDQPIAASADLLAAELRRLRAQGVRSVDIVAHSMGGLVARDTLTRPAYYNAIAANHDTLPDVPRLILLGVPNAGSFWAHARIVMEFRDTLCRFADDPHHDFANLFTGCVDGQGEAGRDLLPGSTFLTELNARPNPGPTRITTVSGALLEGHDKEAIRRWHIFGSADWVPESVVSNVASGMHATSALIGDGAVPTGASTLPGTHDHVIVNADHRSMISRLAFVESVRTFVGLDERRPPAIEIVLDRLAQPLPSMLPPTPSPTLPPQASTTARDSEADSSSN